MEPNLILAGAVVFIVSIPILIALYERRQYSKAQKS